VILHQNEKLVVYFSEHEKIKVCCTVNKHWNSLLKFLGVITSDDII